MSTNQSPTYMQIIALVLTGMSVIGIPLVGWAVSQEKADAVQNVTISNMQREVQEMASDIKDIKTLAVKVLLELQNKKDK